MLTYRRADASDVSQILDLVRASLGPGSVPRTPAYWAWKHLDSPFGPSPVLVAEAEGRIVGLRAFLRWTWRADGRAVDAVQAVDTATHPDWQRRGIFSRLTKDLLAEVRSEGTAFVFNTPNRNSLPGYLKLGWQTVGRVPLWARPLRGALLARGRDGFGADVQGAEAFLAAPQTEAFLAGLRPEPGRYATPRTLPVLRWRYAGPPGIPYHAAWSVSGEAEGAAVLFRARRRGALRVLYLSDVLVSPGPAGARAARSVLRAVLRSAPADVAVAMGVFGAPARRVLGARGFVARPGGGPTFVVHPLHVPPEAPEPTDPAHWGWTLGDIELF